jgi:hypothetical protein
VAIPGRTWSLEGSLAGTEAFEQSRLERNKIEMRFRT